jgi:hypothetical protein
VGLYNVGEIISRRWVYITSVGLYSVGDRGMSANSCIIVSVVTIPSPINRLEHSEPSAGQKSG